jgi:hypothetical protein
MTSTECNLLHKRVEINYIKKTPHARTIYFNEQLFSLCIKPFLTLITRIRTNIHNQFSIIAEMVKEYGLQCAFSTRSKNV